LSRASSGVSLYHEERGGPDLEVTGIATDLGHSAFDVCVNGLGAFHRRLRRKDDFGGFRRQLATGFGCAGLDDDRLALHRPCDVAHLGSYRMQTIHGAALCRSKKLCKAHVRGLIPKHKLKHGD